jgi:abelson tyrosine-protein kinase 1
MLLSGDVRLTGVLFFLFPPRRNAIRRYSYPLRAGHRIAYLCTETTVYRYIENLDAPKQWFKANADKVLELYGGHHPIQRGDLNLGEFSW